MPANSSIASEESGKTESESSGKSVRSNDLHGQGGHTGDRTLLPLERSAPILYESLSDAAFQLQTWGMFEARYYVRGHLELASRELGFRSLNEAWGHGALIDVMSEAMGLWERL